MLFLLSIGSSSYKKPIEQGWRLYSKFSGPIIATDSVILTYPHGICRGAASSNKFLLTASSCIAGSLALAAAA
jgi:hypothetical protein